MALNDEPKQFLSQLKDCKFEPRFITSCEPAQPNDVSISFECEAIHYHLCLGRTNFIRLPEWLADRLPERFISRTYINCKVINES